MVVNPIIQQDVLLHVDSKLCDCDTRNDHAEKISIEPGSQGKIACAMHNVEKQRSHLSKNRLKELMNIFKTVHSFINWSVA